MNNAMKRSFRNLHVPLRPEDYEGLIAEARRARRPATQVAREAIESWVEAKRREARDGALAAYVASMAGTPHDLDPELEAAGLEALRPVRPRRHRTPRLRR